MKETRLQHIHILAKDKYELANWYKEHLGFEIITDIEKLGEKDGPLIISGDGGVTALSVFNRKPRHEGLSINSKPAFEMGAGDFVAYYKKLVSTGGIEDVKVYDHQIFCSYYITDPDGMDIEITTSAHEEARVLLDKEGIGYFGENPTAGND